MVPAYVGYGHLSLPDLRGTRKWDLKLEQRGHWLTLLKYGWAGIPEVSSFDMDLLYPRGDKFDDILGGVEHLDFI